MKKKRVGRESEIEIERERERERDLFDCLKSKQTLQQRCVCPRHSHLVYVVTLKN